MGIYLRGPGTPASGILKQPITIRLDKNTVACFKGLAGEPGIPYQNLINLYLRDCVVSRRRPALEWKAEQDGCTTGE